MSQDLYHQSANYTLPTRPKPNSNAADTDYHFVDRSDGGRSAKVSDSKSVKTNSCSNCSNRGSVESQTSNAATSRPTVINLAPAAMDHNATPKFLQSSKRTILARFEEQADRYDIGTENPISIFYTGVPFEAQSASLERFYFPCHLVRYIREHVYSKFAKYTWPKTHYTHRMKVWICWAGTNEGETLMSRDRMPISEFERLLWAIETRGWRDTLRVEWEEVDIDLKTDSSGRGSEGGYEDTWCT